MEKKYIIADNIRIYRKSKKLTQFQLAEKCNLSIDTIKRIESGRQTTSLDNILKISEVLSIPLSYLLYENMNDMPETERLSCILVGRGNTEKEYLIHMLQEMAKAMDMLS